MKNDLVSVVMSQYNTKESYLREAIESVLNQTYTNFEFIIVDDGSTDASISVIESYNDKRIKLIKKEHTGIPKSLNIGMAVAQGSFIARIDADDVCLPNRFETQVKYLKEHENCIVCGSYAEFIGNKFEKFKSGKYEIDIPNQEEYRIRLLFSNFPTIIHSSAMFNHYLYNENNLKYDERYPNADDYKMWVDCSKVAECANCPEILVKMRRHNASVSHSEKEICILCNKMVIEEQLKPLHLTLPKDWKETHWGCLNHTPSDESKKWINKVIEQNKKYKIYDLDLFEGILLSYKK